MSCTTEGVGVPQKEVFVTMERGGGVGQKVTLHNKGGRGVRNKVFLYNKEGLGVREEEG